MKDDYNRQLAIEAVSVGAAFLPLQYVVSGIISKTAIASRYQPWVAMFVAGAGFHLVAEFAGLNRWYLHHSAASMVDMEAWAKRVKHTPKVEKKCGIRFCGQA